MDHDRAENEANTADLAAEHSRLLAESERSRQLAEAQTNELEAIFRNVPAGLALYDTSPELRCIRHNAGFLALIGQDWQSRGSIVGVALRDLFDEQSYQATRSLFAAALARDEVLTIDEYAAVLLPDPLPRYYKWSITPLKDAAHQTTGLLVSAIEITEQIRARERIADLARLADAKTAQIQLILDSIADGVWVCDAQGRVIEVNRRAIELLGMAEKYANLRPLDDYEHLFATRHSDGTPMPREAFPLIRALAGVLVVDELLVRNASTGGDTWLQISAAPLYDSRGELSGAVAVGRDITANVDLNRQKDEFLSLVAHELHTPITVIKGLTQASERRFSHKIERYTANNLFSFDELDKYAQQLRSIVRQTNRLDRLVNELLDISRMADTYGPINREQFNLVAQVAEVVERFQSTVTGHIIMLEPAPAEMCVEGDQERIEQVITNLLQNAVKYSPAGAPIQVRLRADAEFASVSVRDFGIGVPADEQARLFSRFFRARNAPSQRYDGLGLGLYLSAEIVKRHGGQMAVESQEGAGSMFSFTLPIASPS